MKRKRNMCLECPACFKPLKDGLAATAGGYEERMIGDQMMVCCRPGTAGESRKRVMDKYDYYCLATEKGKKIAKGADYTGLTPKWCPRLKENGK